MNKKIALFIIVVAIVGCLALTACDGFGGAQANGTYYGYSGTEKDSSDYIKLESGKWTDGTLDGTYELDGEKIVLSSDGVAMASGTVKDGILTLVSLGLSRKYYTDAAWAAYGTQTPDDNNGGNGNGGSISSGEEDDKAKIVSVQGAVVDGLSVNMELSNDVDTVDLSGLVTVSDNSSWKLYINSAATAADAIATKMIAPIDGESVYYIVVTSSDAKVDRTYTLRVWKNYYVNITWTMAGITMDTERVLTHTTLSDHAPGVVPGYEFIAWNYGNRYVEGSRTIEAEYRNARYNITLDAQGGDEHEDLEVSYLSSVYLPTPEREGYTFNGWSISGLEIENNYIGSYTLTSDARATASWTINKYAVSVVRGIDDNGTVDELDSDEYDYGNRVLLTATPLLGYELEGWYECNRVGEPVNKISEEKSFYYSVPSHDSVIRAIWKVRDDMSNFEFDSGKSGSSRWCTITGVKDKTITTLSLPNCVTSVRDNVFNDCTEITSAKMNGQKLNGFGDANTKLTHLEIISGALSYNDNCKYVTHLTIGKSVSSIVILAWADSKNLVSLTFEEGFSGKVKSNAFQNCTKLSEINIPDSLVELEFKVFENTAWYNSQPDGEVYLGKIFYAYKGEMPENTSVVLKEDTLAIAGNAFDGKTNLTSVTVASGVTYIGCYAFRDCTGLKEITFSELSWYKEPRSGGGSSTVSVTMSETPSENASEFVDNSSYFYYRVTE